MVPPTEDEVIGWVDSLSNWGRWGRDDQLGTLNLVTPEKRRQAAALVREGISVSCALDITTRPEPGAGLPPQRYMIATGEGLADEHRVRVPGFETERMAGAVEFIGLVYHGFTVTHVDGLCHVFWDRKMYNGRPAELVTAGRGATDLAITGLRDGVVTRGILLDVAAVKGRDWLDGGEGVHPSDLEAAEAAAGVTVSEGDAVLLRTGYGRLRRERRQAGIPPEGVPGWHASSLPWLHERGVALIGCDTGQDVMPSGYSAMPLPVHIVGIVAMGLWLVDNANLEELAQTCQRLSRWEFQFVVAPLRFQGGTGSPANPIAVF